MNQRPSGYEPDELPDCSIPHQKTACTQLSGSKLVRKGGLEPPRPKALPPQGSVSTNSTTTAACGTHSSPSHRKRKALFRIIDSISVHLVKFQAMSFELALSFVQFSNYMPRSSVFLRKQRELNSSQKTTLLR